MYKFLAAVILLCTTQFAQATNTEPDKSPFDQMIERFDETIDSLSKNNDALEELTEDFSAAGERLQELNQALQQSLREQELVSDSLKTLEKTLDRLEAHLGAYHERAKGAGRKFRARMKATHCQIPMDKHAMRVVRFLDINCLEEEI